MKTWVYFIALFLACNSVYAYESVNIKVSATAPCSTAIGINHGKVIINCIDPDLAAKIRALPELSAFNANMSQLEKLAKSADTFRVRLNHMERDMIANTKAVGQLGESLRNSESQYSRIYQRHMQLSSHLAGELARLPEIVGGEISKFAEPFLHHHLQKHTKDIFFEVDEKLDKLRNRLVLVEHRVDSLENDVSFLMGEYLNGQLQNSVAFFGLSIGGLNIADEWQSRFGIEYELLLPTVQIFGSRTSVYIELAKLDWKEEQQRQTLPGVKPIEIVDNHEINLLILGGRLFALGWSENLHSYIGLSFGHSFSGDEDTYTYGIGFGTEYFRAGARVAFEFRWEGFSDVEREEIIFNPLGDASITTVTESTDGWYAGIKIAFH